MSILDRMLKHFGRRYGAIVLGLLLAQYVSVNLIFATITQNIVLPKDLLAPFFSILVLGAWMTGDLLTTGRWILPRHGIVAPMVAALLYWTALVPASPTGPSAVELVGRTACYFISAWAMIRFLDTRKRLFLVLKTILVTNLLMVLYGLTQILDMDLLVHFQVIPDWGSRVFVSTHGSPNFFSGVLITTLPLLFGWYLITRNRPLCVALGAVMALSVYEIIMSTNRGAYMATFLSTSLALLWLLPWLIRHIRQVRTWVPLLLIVALLGGIMLAAASPNFRERIMGPGEASRASWVRLVFFQMALDGARREPWLGRGMGSFNFRMPETRPAHYHRTGVSHNTDHPHNEHFEWLHDTGLIGLAFFWLILAAYLATSLRAVRRHRRTDLYPLVLCALFGPVNAWIQSSFDVETRWTGNNVTLWFVVGLVAALGRLATTPLKPVLAPVTQSTDETGNGEEEVPVAPASAPELDVTIAPHHPFVLRACAAASAALVVAIVYVIFAHRIWMADHHLRNCMAFTDGGSFSAERALKEALAAKRLNPDQVSNYYKLAYTFLLLNRLPEAMDAYRDLQSYAPHYAQIHINLAYLDDAMGYRSASARERDRAASIEHNIRNHRDAAQYWLTLGYSDRALAHLRLARTMETDRLEDGYHFWPQLDSSDVDMGRIYLRRGKPARATEVAQEILRFAPGSAAAALILLDTSVIDFAGADWIEVLRARAPENPALLLADVRRAIDQGEIDTALALTEVAARGLPLPTRHSEVPIEMVYLTNSLLAELQRISNRNIERAKCFEAAGRVYACQGRYEEAESLLSRAYAANPSPDLAKMYGEVRARRRESP